MQMTRYEVLIDAGITAKFERNLLRTAGLPHTFVREDDTIRMPGKLVQVRAAYTFLLAKAEIEVMEQLINSSLAQGQSATVIQTKVDVSVISHN